MSWYWTIIFLVFALSNTSESKPQKPSAVIVGTVYCNTCFQQTLPRDTQFSIAGASVAVECKATKSIRSFRQEVKTDRHGEFKVHLPFPVSKHLREIRGCSVRLISSNKPYCAVAASATSSSNLHLKARKDGTHVFSAGFFTFRPLKQPLVCDQKPRPLKQPLVCDQKPSANKKPASINGILSQISNPNDPAFPPPIQDPSSDPPSLGSFLPPLPRLPPLPQLPHLPPLPGLPFLPPTPKDQIGNNDLPRFSESVVNQLPTNPFSSPSSGVLPPNDFPPPASILPSPPSSNTLPVPGDLSPPSPFLPPPLPPFPFQPSHGFPGVPAAKVSSSSEKSSP